LGTDAPDKTPPMWCSLPDFRPGFTFYLSFTACRHKKQPPRFVNPRYADGNIFLKKSPKSGMVASTYICYNNSETDHTRG
jgi:hypothetical protein